MTSPPEICVLGRSDFFSGIGSVSYAACELLSRNFPVCLYPTDTTHSHADYTTLPNGRHIPICRDLSTMKVFFFTDVLWNGAYDLNYTLVPKHGLKIAHIAYDSDEFPEKWVDILNQNFDVVYFSSHYLEDIAVKSGVRIPVGTLPIGLDLDPLLTQPMKLPQKTVCFGSIAAFHQRKGLDILAEAFAKEFSQRENVKLIIHSNVAMGDTYQKVLDIVDTSNAKNIILNHEHLSTDSKIAMLSSMDIFVNCSRGEGYSIGPREAMALGKVVVLSDIAAHHDLLGVPGVFAIAPTISVPARYPEINNQIFGKQKTVTVDAVRKVLREAYHYFMSDNTPLSIHERKRRANEFSFHQLTRNYAETLTPDIAQFRKNAKTCRYTHISESCKHVAISKLGRFGAEFDTINRTVLPAHDGGFFSVFNVFMSHLVWDLKDDKCHMVLPDWDVSRLLTRKGDEKLVSFCYGKPTDGNIWLKLFKPLYGLSADEMNDVQFLYDKASIPTHLFNDMREPNLTYTNAFSLYKSASFKSFREQYHKVLTTHVELLPELQLEVDTFCQKHFDGKFMLAAHVKHPSHMIEQPDMQIANGQAFIDAIKRKLEEKGIAVKSNDWGVFLGTDQDRVVAQFKEAFGDNLYYFNDVRRCKFEEDERFDQLTDSEKAKEGFQVQHLVAATPENWSIQMAWEVIRDATAMSRCQVLFHVVSNVSTAISYFNPAIQLEFVT